MGVDVLLGIPTESITVRLIVASVFAVLLARLLLAAGLRVPRVRATVVLVPPLALLLVSLLQWGTPRLPVLMLPVDAVGGLALPVGGDYVNVAPMAAPLFLALWAVVAGGRVAIRLRQLLATRGRARRAFRTAPELPPRVTATVHRVAGRMGVPPPPVAMTDRCPGGATVVGVRRPLVLLDRRLAAAMDELELEGVLAHEMAHIKRRDNLVALVLGVIRDVAFFVPGGRWALRHLHCERELAADQVAVASTGRPGALASGLLKVIDAGSQEVACATLMTEGTVVDRVRHLVDDDEPVGRVRSGLEVGLVLAVLAGSVGAAVGIPSFVADGGTRDGVAVFWQGEAAAPEEPVRDVEPRAFQVYRSSEITEPDTVTGPPVMDDDPIEMRRSTLAACAAGARCQDREQRPGLPLRPRPQAIVEDGLLDRWRWEARALVENEEGLSVYILSRSSVAGPGGGGEHDSPVGTLAR